MEKMEKSKKQYSVGRLAALFVCLFFIGITNYLITTNITF